MLFSFRGRNRANDVYFMSTYLRQKMSIHFTYSELKVKGLSVFFQI